MRVRRPRRPSTPVTRPPGRYRRQRFVRSTSPQEGSMRHRMVAPHGLATLLVALAGLLAPSLAAQQTGRVVGRVTDAQSGAPISEAQVFIPGSGLGGLTRANGAFVILEVPAGPKELRAERIGLAPVSQQITVVAGQAVEVNIQMTTQALGLDEIVVTGTAGAARRREVGNTIAQINVANRTNQPAQAVELLQAAAPGIQVTGGNGGDRKSGV